jgi:hypothetical protein
MQQPARDLRDGSLDISIFKKGKERARNILRASPIEPRELRGRCQSKPRDVLQQGNIAIRYAQWPRLFRPLKKPAPCSLTGLHLQQSPNFIDH